MYRCKTCGRQFVGGGCLNLEELITAYIEGKQTISQLSVQNNVSKSTVQRCLKGMRYKQKIAKDRQVIVLMDTTYWGRNFGLVLFKDALRNKVLWHKYVNRETVADYREGIDWLVGKGFRIYGIVCDGMRGLFGEFKVYPVQMCQFHQILIVRRYLTRSPELQPSRELLTLVEQLTHMDKESFTRAFGEWEERWQPFLKERSRDASTGRSRHTHARLRSAYLSVRRNMPWLWTFYDYHHLGIPNTNNGLEGIFADIKSKVRVHSGLKKETRKRFIDEYLVRVY